MSAKPPKFRERTFFDKFLILFLSFSAFYNCTVNDYEYRLLINEYILEFKIIFLKSSAVMNLYD